MNVRRFQTGPRLGPAPAPAGMAAWRSDLALFRRELPLRHPAPFLNVTAARWDSAAAALDHPHVLPLYEAGEHEGVLFIAMRWVDGTDLGHEIAASTGGPGSRTMSSADSDRVIECANVKPVMASSTRRIDPARIRRPVR